MNANVKKSKRRGGNYRSSHDTSHTINVDTIREGGGTEEGEAQPLTIVTSENKTRERKATQLKHKLNGNRRRGICENYDRILRSPRTCLEIENCTKRPLLLEMSGNTSTESRSGRG